MGADRWTKVKQAMQKLNKRLKKQRQKEERQLSGGILPTSL